jgi:hypothetical protein
MFSFKSAVWGEVMRAFGLVLLSAVLSGVLAVAPAQAHHSAAQYDFKTQVVLKGSVKEIRVANPHMRLVLHVSDDKGARDLELEGHSLNNIYRRGWRVGLVKPGDAITVTIAPRKDGAEGGYVVGVKTADGHEF